MRVMMTMSEMLYQREVADVCFYSVTKKERKCREERAYTAAQITDHSGRQTQVDTYCSGNKSESIWYP